MHLNEQSQHATEDIAFRSEVFRSGVWVNEDKSSEMQGMNVRD
jgi:hypothetical protein